MQNVVAVIEVEVQGGVGRGANGARTEQEVLGDDFNIDRRGDVLYETFVGTGLTPAPEHVGLPRTIFDDTDTPHFYDQIAWFTGFSGTPQLTPPLAYENLGGNFDFKPALQRSLSTTELSWRISDHYPLWASFSVRATSD